MAAYTRETESINPEVPPLHVRHLPTGRCSRWSPLFRKTIQNYAPHFLTADEEQRYRVRIRHWIAAQALRNGDPYAGLDVRHSSDALPPQFAFVDDGLGPLLHDNA